MRIHACRKRTAHIMSTTRRWTLLALVLMVWPAVAFAQSPWERAAANLEASFTGPLARSMALVAIVIGGLMFMFGEGGAKRPGRFWTRPRPSHPKGFLRMRRPTR